MLTRIADQTGADAAHHRRRLCSGARQLWPDRDSTAPIDALDDAIPGGLQLRLYGQVQDLLLSRMVWFIRNVDWSSEGLDAVVSRFGEGVSTVEAALHEALPRPAVEAAGRRAADLMKDGVPEPLALRLAVLPQLFAAPDIVLVAARCSRPIAAVAATHFAIGARFKLADIANAARDVPLADYYDRLALDRALATMETAHRALTVEASQTGTGAGADAVAAWSEKRGAEADRIIAAVEAIAGSGLTLSKLTVAASLLADLAKT